MDFTLPEHLPALLAEMDAFIDAEIKPLERENMQYFDRRREFARTDLDKGGIPNRDWEDLLDEMRRRHDRVPLRDDEVFRSAAAGLAFNPPVVGQRRLQRNAGLGIFLGTRTADSESSHGGNTRM